MVCDSVGQVCYDSDGPSIGMTQINYSQVATDNLQRNLSQTNSRDFRWSVTFVDQAPTGIFRQSEAVGNPIGNPLNSLFGR